MQSTISRPRVHDDVRQDLPIPNRDLAGGDREQADLLRDAIVAAVLLVVVAMTFWGISGSAPDQTMATSTDSAISEEEVLQRLIVRGYVPDQPDDAEAEATERLQRRGLVPDAAIPPPLHTVEEQAVLDLVRTGFLPEEVLTGEVFATKRLMNRGLVPAGSAP